MLEGVTIEQLRTLRAVAEAGSFSAAARKLGRVQAAVSQAIDRLEAQLGLRLFDRSGQAAEGCPSADVLLAEIRWRTNELESRCAGRRGFCGSMAPMKQPSPPSTATRTEYDAIAEGLLPAGVQSSAMFGMPALKLAGKAFAGLFGDAMVFKLAGADHARALGLAGAELFDPAAMGRPMKAWVVLPIAHAERWREFAQAAMHAVEEDGAAGKAPAKKGAAGTRTGAGETKKTAAKKSAKKAVGSRRA